jgi:hypothetical protein
MWVRFVGPGDIGAPPSGPKVIHAVEITAGQN